MEKYELSISVTAPFITTIDTNHTKDSSIQEYRSNSLITMTQQYCDYLRRDMSVLNFKNNINTIIELAEKLNRKASDQQILRGSIIKAINTIGQKEELFRYKKQTRLLGEPRNQQT